MIESWQIISFLLVLAFTFFGGWMYYWFNKKEISIEKKIHEILGNDEFDNDQALFKAFKIWSEWRKIDLDFSIIKSIDQVPKYYLAKFYRWLRKYSRAKFRNRLYDAFAHRQRVRFKMKALHRLQGKRKYPVLTDSINSRLKN